MNILIDIGHPAHVHLFKYFTWRMRDEGNNIFFTCRHKEFEIQLLKKYGFSYVSFGNKFQSRLGKILGLLKFDTQTLFAAVKFKPDLFLSCGSMYAAHAAFLLRKPHISFEDTGNKEQVRLYLPFTKCVLTSDTFPFNYGSKQIRYKGHHEIAYLHPNQFNPVKDFKSSIGLKQEDRYIIIRFVSWKATHDKGQRGFDEKTKIKLIEFLEKKYKILISSESVLPDHLKKYAVKFPPEEMHQALYHADLFIGEGTTMAMEAALLGTPSVYVNSLQYNNIRDMVKHELAFSFEDSKNVYEKVVELSQVDDIKKSWQNKRNSLFRQKIDVTEFMIWFISNFPKSFQILRDDPDYQNRFN